MEIRPIRNKVDYEAAIAEIERLMDRESDPAVADKLEVLATLVTSWREKNLPLRPSGPVAALTHAMEDRGLTRRDLALAIGSESKVSEVLSGKRALSAVMIAELHKRFGIPLRSLVDLDVERKPRGRKTQRFAPRAAIRTQPFAG